jgi:integrase
MSDCFNWRHRILSWRVRRPLLRVRLPYWPSSRNDADASTRTATGKPCGTFALARARASEFTLSSDGGLFRWAREAGHIKTDPTDGVKNPPRKKGDGFIPWTEEDVAKYEARWPIGTRQRVWLDVLLYTGLRRGDAVRLGRQHVRNGVATIRTEKSQERVEVTLLILPVLAATLEVGPTGDLTFICGASGRPLTKESFGNEFKGACKAAGLPGSAHGVRKIAATRAANSGATVAQLEAILGWQGGTMASLYTRSADRRRLALEAKLANNERTSIPAPSDPGAGGKAKRQMKSMLLFRRGAAERTRTSTVLPASTSS